MAPATSIISGFFQKTEAMAKADGVEVCPALDRAGCRIGRVRIKLERTFETGPVSGYGFPMNDRHMSSPSTTRALEHPSSADTRFDRRLGEILDYATEVFAEKGYEGASMRDLSRLSGISLAGLYYYFESKEKLLYFIQQHTFNTIIERLRERLQESHDPETRIRTFVHNHISYSVAKQKAMKVLAHEGDVLKDGLGTELAATKREYYRICVGLVEDLVKAEGLKFVGRHAGLTGGIGTRTAVLGLFGMMNWLHTWYKPRVDPDARNHRRRDERYFSAGSASGKGRRLEAASGARTSAVRPETNGRPRAKGAKRKPAPPLATGRTRS